MPPSDPRLHSAALYDLNAHFLGGTRGEDLWTHMKARQLWLVDNNVPWETLARAEPSANFLLGRTIALESDSLRPRLLKKLRTDPLGNVFTLEIIEVSQRRCFVIDRLDANFGGKFSGPLPTVESRLRNGDEEINSPRIRETKRQWVTGQKNTPRAQLQAAVNRNKPHCYANYALSGETSLLCYAMHLAELRQMMQQTPSAAKRVDHFETNSANLFGDAELVQEALFLSCGIVSNDETDVGAMSAIAGIAFRTWRTSGAIPP
ncbi:MAG: hypothetical protein WC661_14395 [Opitutaceae bacterium]|jgi:hypothetical protein